MPEKARISSGEFKVWVIRRTQAGERVRAIARERQVRRKDLYLWQERFRTREAEALRGRGRPRKVVSRAPPGTGSLAADLAAAQQRIVELERKIGQQQLELFLLASLAASQRTAPAARRVWRYAVYALIEAMTAALPQGGLPGRAAVRAGRGEPHRLLPPLARRDAAPQGNRGARRDPAAS